MSEDKSTALASLRPDSDFKIGLEPTDIKSALDLCVVIHKSGLFGVKSPEDAMMRVMTARSLGLPAIVGLRKMHSIEGKLGLDADLILALCLQHPACEAFDFVETTHEKCTVRAKRKGRPELVYTYTIEDAKRALLLDRGETEEKKAKSNWNRQPRNMLRARCTTDVARMIFPEASMGIASVEELIDERNTFTVDPKTGEVLEPGVTASATTPPATPARDWKKEADALIAEIDAVATKEQKTAVREKITSSEIPPIYLAAAETRYNEKFVKGWKPTEASKPAEGATP